MTTKELKVLFWTQELRNDKPVKVELRYDYQWLMNLCRKAASNKTGRCSYGPVRAVVIKTRKGAK